MLVMCMFYTRSEMGERFGWANQCNSLGVIISGFLSFGVAHISSTSHVHPWQWLMIITSVLGFVLSILFLFLFPDNPTNARFLTAHEQLGIVKRTRGNQIGIETKVWKKKQLLEALYDIKTWLFFLFITIFNLSAGINVEYSRIIQAYGFSSLQTTLLNIPSALSQMIGINIASYFMRKPQISRAWIILGLISPMVLAAVLQMALAQSNKAGHLVAIYIQNMGGLSVLAVSMDWVVSTTAGHTKRLATNAIFLAGYSLGQTLCTQFWKQQYSPHFLVPWGITLASIVSAAGIVVLLRWILSNRNISREASEAATIHNDKYNDRFNDSGLVAITDEKGGIVMVEVDKSLLDITDKDNLSFRYVL